MEGTKGIYHQMLERSKEPTKQITLKELSELMEAALKQRSIDLKNREKQAKKNAKELAKRSKELGKPIPFLVGYYLTSLDTHYVGSDFLKKYKEWL